MAWSQELKLLDRLSAATSTTQFIKCGTDIDKLRERVEDLTQGHLKRLLSDGVFARRLFTAASSGLNAISATFEKGILPAREGSRCVAAFLALVNNVLEFCLCLAPRTPQEFLRSVPVLAIALMADAQATIKQTDFLNNMANACAASAAVMKNLFLQPRHTCSDHSAEAAGDDITIISSMSFTLLNLWSNLGAIWGIVALGDLDAKVHVPLQSCMHSWSDPQLQATIQSGFSLLKALIDLQPSCTHSSAFSRAMAPVWDAVLSASAYVWSDAMAEFGEDEERLISDRMRQIMEAPDVQDLQLLILAAVAGGLHSQQKGASSTQVLDSWKAHKTADSSTSKGKDRNKQHKQQLRVTDRSAQVLQQLRLTKDYGQQLFKMLISRNGSNFLDVIVVNSVHLLGHGAAAHLFDSKCHAAPPPLPILEVQLVMEIILLMPDLSIMPSALFCLIQMALACNKLVICHDERVRSTMAAAVADNILAPMLLDVGPVVLGLKHDRCNSQWALAIQHFWALVTTNTPDSAQSAVGNDPACGVWTSIMKQHPCTAVTAVEAALRAASEGAHVKMMSADNINMCAMHTTLDLVCMMMDAVAGHCVVQGETATTVMHTFKSSNSSHNSSWPSFNNQTLAAKSVSLFISSLKLLETYTTLMAWSIDEKPRLLKAALRAFRAAQEVVVVAAIAPNATAAVVVPWVYVAAQALHCFAMVLLSASDKTDMIDPLFIGKIPFLLLWPRLGEDVGWCDAQLSKLQSQGVSVSSSGSSGASSSNATLSAQECACPLPKDLVQLLQQQSKQLQQFLLAMTKGLLEVGGVGDLGSRKGGWGPAMCRDSYKVARQLHEYVANLCAVLPTTLYCNNPSCSNVSDVSELICVGRRKCSRCQAAGYCSRDCQKKHWSQHKKFCDWLTQ